MHQSKVAIISKSTSAFIPLQKDLKENYMDVCDAYAVSNVIAGAGLSSSASFEVLLGNIFNRFSCGGALDPITIAKVGQYGSH